MSTPSQPASLDAVARAIQERLGPGPYRVSPEHGGIRIGVDLADRSWWNLAERNHLAEVLEVLLAPKKPGVFARTDRSQSVEWSAGAPTLGAARASTQRGRQWTYQRRTDLAVTPSGAERAVDIDFSTGHVNEAIADALKATGWRTALDGNSKAGLIVAIAALGFAVGIGIVLLIFAMTGAFG